MVDFGKFDLESKNHLVCIFSWTLSLLGCSKASKFKNMVCGSVSDGLCNPVALPGSCRPAGRS